MRVPFAAKPTIPLPRFTYSYQTFSVGQVLTAAQVQQIEDNVRDHIHGEDSVVAQPGASLVLLDTASLGGVSVATVDFTSGFSSDYDAYLIQFQELICATDGTDLWVRLDANGGASFDTANYRWGRTLINENASATELHGSNSDSKWMLFNNQGSDSGRDAYGYIYLYPTLSGFGAVWSLAYQNNVGLAKQAHGFGTYGVGNINAIRFMYSSGNVDDGDFQFYGLKNT